MGVDHGRALTPRPQNHISGSDHSAARWHGALYPAAEVVTWICDLDVERPADVAARLQRWFTLTKHKAATPSSLPLSLPNLALTISKFVLKPMKMIIKHYGD